MFIRSAQVKQQPDTKNNTRKTSKNIFNNSVCSKTESTKIHNHLPPNPTTLSCLPTLAPILIQFERGSTSTLILQFSSSIQSTLLRQRVPQFSPILTRSIAPTLPHCCAVSKVTHPSSYLGVTPGRIRCEGTRCPYLTQPPKVGWLSGACARVWCERLDAFAPCVGPTDPQRTFHQNLRALLASRTQIDTACKDGPKSRLQHLLKGDSGILLSVHKQNSTSSDATCNLSIASEEG